MEAARVWFHADAVEEARAAYAWYRERSPAVAESFMAELDRSISVVLEDPTRWTIYVAGTRRFLMRRFPYVVVYREVSGSVQVLAVAHAHRRPGYWRGRNE